ncbi:MAG: hypothetical protein DMD35_01230 [Gemmatimonadetes bacterium]|nr:MAG: hypothetical protein DMD35_01230 [Gemmatimonadota bacterium]
MKSVDSTAGADVRDFLAFLGAMYGAVVGGVAGSAVLAERSFGVPLRHGLVGTSGLALMGLGILAYSFIKFAND